MPLRDIVVIGASAGGVEACRKLVASLPPDFGGSIFIVIHLPRNGVSLMPQLLSHWGPLPAVHPKDGAPILPARIYVAPPDFHMLVKSGKISLIAGPEENYARPAIDPLFRSAAAAYGSRVIGVVLSGNLDDGTAGLRAIQRKGGTTVVQDPKDALFSGMPASAAANVHVDHILPLDGIASLLADLVQTETAVMANPGEKEEEDILEISLDDLQSRVEKGNATGLTCPQCGGILRESVNGDAAEFRCRVGHAFSSGNLETALAENVESALWNAIRVLEEKEQLYHRLAARMGKMDIARSANHFETRGKKASQDARIIRKIIIEGEKKVEGS